MRVSRYLLGTARELSSFDDINTVVEEQIQRRASLPPQLVRATSSEGSSGSMLSHGTVPTEVLSSTHSHEGLTLPDEAPPVECFLRLLTQRPRLVISAIYLFTVLIMTLMWAFGDIQLVLDEDAFKDTKNIEVARHANSYSPPRVPTPRLLPSRCARCGGPGHRAPPLPATWQTPSQP